MRMIINGRKYDTETAELIESYDNGRYGNDFGQLSESLYRKKNGEFFLHGEGGPMTVYREAVGSMWTNGEKLIPLSVDEAKAWAEKHCSVEMFEEVFGEVEE